MSAKHVAKPVAKFLTVQVLNYLGYLVLSPIVALSVALVSVDVATGGGAVNTGVDAGGDSMVLRGIQFTAIASIMVGLMFGTSLVPVSISHLLDRVGDWLHAEW